MRIDLHTHSAASDGTDPPAALIGLAFEAGLDVVAITDHDTTAGWAPAAAARPEPLTLIRGAEFSTHVEVGGRRRSIHLLGYLFDPDDPAIVAEQARLVAERLHRGLMIVRKMVADGIPISEQQVLDIAAGAPVGRPHIGRALVAAGEVSTVTEAFENLLAGGGRYYVPKDDTELPVAIRMIAEAGGASVIAHPRGRAEFTVLDRDRIRDLKEAGLTGLEVDHPDHTARERAELAAIAAELDLIPTGSSDYHGSNKVLRLGQETTSPDALDRLLAATSGATVPLGPVA